MTVQIVRKTTMMLVVAARLPTWGLARPSTDFLRRTLVVGLGQGLPLVVLFLGFHSALMSLSRSLAEPWRRCKDRA